MTREIASRRCQRHRCRLAGDERTSARDRAAGCKMICRPSRRAIMRAAAPLDHATIRAIVAGIMLAMFLSALEQTIVAPALPAIGKSLGDIDDLSWVVTAYLLAATVATPLFGKLSDIYGRRALLLAAIGIFIAGSVACALAPTIWMLILSRALQGIGGGGLLPIAQTIIADLLSPRERPVVQGRTSIMFMSASILGPVLGGLLTDHLHWSLIFWINLPLGAVALVMTERALRRLPRNDRPHQLDVIGAALMVGAALALMLALAWGGTHYPWSSWRIITLIASSAALWVLFAHAAAHRARAVHSAGDPARPGDQHDHLRGVLQHRHHHRRDDLHAALLPDRARRLGEPLRPGADRLYGRRHARLAGVDARHRAHQALHARADGRPRSSPSRRLRVLAVRSGRAYARCEVVGLLLVLGFGIGPMYPVSTIVMQNVVKPHQLGTATGTLNFFRTLGGAIVVAVFGAIVLGGIGDHPGAMTLEKIAAGHGDLAPAFHWVFIAAAVCLGVSFLCLLVVEERPLHGPMRVAGARHRIGCKIRPRHG